MPVREVEILWDRVKPEERGRHPFDIPFMRNLGMLRFPSAVTYLVGDNGSGKSTLLEGIARALDLNPEGGTGNMLFANTDRDSVSGLYRRLRVARTSVHRNSTFFLRAESFFNVAEAVDRYDEGSGDLLAAYGGTSLHDQSHGESFLAVAMNRWVPGGLYLLDEPEAALSLHGQLKLLRLIYELSHDGAQFIVATHSPILISLPEAQIVECTDDGPQVVSYDDSELVSLYRTFLDAPERFLRHLLDD